MAFLQQHEEQAKEGKRWRVTDLGPGSAGQGRQGAGKQVAEGIYYGVQAGEGGVKPEER